MREGEQIHRSSHALVDDHADLATDANSAEQLFEALKDKDCVVFAHIGGRYADIKMAHDARIERSVEVHSDWGTFEWLLHDALEQGYRVGILANSDGHKGRHGASHPGASLFGAYGGLSCLLADELTRAGLVDALRRRHHYATTGCRLVLDVRAAFDAEAELYADDPQLGPTTSTPVRTAMMGDILRSDEGSVEFTRRGAGLGADRAARDPQRPRCAGDLAALRRGRAGAAHPGDLGGIGISRARPPDDLGRRLHADRQRVRARSPRSICGTSTRS